MSDEKQPPKPETRPAEQFIATHSEQPIRPPSFSEQPPMSSKEVLKAAPKPPKGD